MVQQNDNSIQVQWSDNHRSDYQLDWLKLRDFDLENRKKYLEEIYRPKSSHWNKQNFTQTLQKFDYMDIMNKDQGILHVVFCVDFVEN